MSAMLESYSGQGWLLCRTEENRLELRHLRYFVAVADAGNFSRAAERLQVAQPTLSRQIAALEAEVGCALLLRHSRGVSATEAGSTMLAHARSILEQAEQAVVITSTRARVAHGMAALGAPHAMGRIIFGPVAQNYRQRFPGVTLRFAEGLSYVLLEWLDAGRIDLAILTNVSLDKRYRAVHLVTEPVYALGPAGHALTASKRASVSLKELADYPLIISSPQNQVRQLVTKAAAAQGVSLTVSIEADDPHTVKALVARGLGIALLSYSSAAAEIESGELSGKRVELLRHERFLVQRRQPAPSKAVAELARSVIATVDERFHAGAFGDPGMVTGRRRGSAR